MQIKLFSKSLLFCFALFSTSDAFSQDPTKNIKVGVILPLTGPIAEYGVASKNGIELAIKEKAELFKSIDFVY